MALRKKRGAEFMRVWDVFDTEFGSKGSMEKAEIQFDKMKLTESDVSELIGIIVQQKAERVGLKAHNIWKENFQHVYLYLKNGRYEDEPDNRGIHAKALPRSDQRKASAAERYIANHLAEGVDQVGSGQGSLGGARQLNIGVLESKS